MRKNCISGSFLFFPPKSKENTNIFVQKVDKPYEICQFFQENNLLLLFVLMIMLVCMSNFNVRLFIMMRKPMSYYKKWNQIWMGYDLVLYR